MAETAARPATIRVPGWFQGPTGTGQGGFTSARVAAAVGQRVTVRLRAPVPLDVDLTVEGSAAEGWRCRAGDAVVLEAAPWSPDVPDTAPVTVAQAAEARARFPVSAEEHPVPHCFSCGLQPDGMGVHAGPLAEGPGSPVRYATDWTVPEWSDQGDGTADPAVLWAALDCTAAWFVACHPQRRRSVTAQYAVEALRPVVPGERLALVSWDGDWPGGWDGRKRGAASAAFDGDGAVVARARSFWIALD